MGTGKNLIGKFQWLGQGVHRRSQLSDPRFPAANWRKVKADEPLGLNNPRQPVDSFVVIENSEIEHEKLNENVKNSAVISILHHVFAASH